MKLIRAVNQDHKTDAARRPGPVTNPSDVSRTDRRPLSRACLSRAAQPQRAHLTLQSGTCWPSREPHLPAHPALCPSRLSNLLCDSLSPQIPPESAPSLAHRLLSFG